jgi:glycoside/pentoside/hexuronide:cation symporter, GPH family
VTKLVVKLGLNLRLVSRSSPMSESSLAPTDKLSFWTKLAYGAGDTGPAMTANILAICLLVFLINVAGMDAGLAGLTLGVGKIWDAVNDPVVGVLSDRSKHRWGRRLPWLFWGAIPFGLTFLMQWVVPFKNQWWLFGFYVLVSVLFNSFYTVVNLPYTAMTAELTQDYDERTSLSSFRFMFSIGGSIVSLLIALLIFKVMGKDSPERFLVLAIVIAVISVATLYWCVWGTKRRVLTVEKLRLASPIEPELPFRQQVSIALSNRPFLFVIGLYLCSWFALQNTVAFIPFFVKNYMGLDEQTYFSVLIAVQVMAFLMLGVWRSIAERVGKKAVYMMGNALWMIAEMGLFLLKPGQTGMLYALGVVIGMGVSTAYLIPWSMIPDVIEVDELKTGQRREGVFYSFMVLLQKIVLAVALAIVGQTLQAAGFISQQTGQPEPVQPIAALDAIRWMVGPLPALVLAIGIALAYFYPITKEKHAEIVLRLAERKRNQGIEN